MDITVYHKLCKERFTKLKSKTETYENQFKYSSTRL